MKPPIPNPLQTPNPETLKIHATLNPKGLFACVAFWKYLPSGRWAAKMRLLNLMFLGVLSEHYCAGPIVRPTRVNDTLRYSATPQERVC